MSDTMIETGQAAEARRLADEFWEDLLRIEPVLATEVGDERFDDRLADVSEAGIDDRRTVNASALERLAAIDRTSLEPVLRGTLDILEAVARRDLANIDAHLERLEAVSQIWGPAQIVGIFASFQKADTPERLERYLGRLRAVPTYLGAFGDHMRAGIAGGQTAPGVVVDRTIAQVERFLDAGADGSPALAPAGSDDDAKGQVADVLEAVVLPAHRRYLEDLRAYRPHATETIGLSALPGGDAIYASQILAWTSLPLSAEEIHRIGVEELAKIQESRRAIAAGLGFDDVAAAIAAYEETGANVAESREQMVAIAEGQVQRGWDASPAMFGVRPSANCEVKPIEEFREADMPFAFYQPPSADGSRAGVYYVNTSDLPGRPLHHLATTTYHEANPGHHFQVTLEAEMPERPALRRFGGILAGSAFIEGWGLYSERLADEMGLFVDEYERLGMLDAQGMRAARLIVDSGIHALGWDRKRAIAQMIEAGVPPLDAEIETDRYISMPGQACAYMIGQLEIQRWRRDATEREGSAFDLRAFHDRLLALGSLPLPALRREMGS